MKYSEIHKKGYGIPTESELIEGGIGVDVQGKRAYSKAADGTIFPIGGDDSINAEDFDLLWKGKFSFDLATRTLTISE